MGKIVILDEKTANQIAAGEVIERPASVVKEMVENAIDAGATQITVEIRNGGISYIRITDNGSGIEGDDVELAFERHATSKMRRIEDLDSLSTMGFRGEALASIAAVSHLEVMTKTEDAPVGTLLKMEGGRVLSVSQTGCPKGTTFIIRNLFYNTPARYKFLKKDTTEAGYVSDILERLALAHPGISFKFIQNNQVILHTPGNHDLLSVIYSIYGKDVARLVLPVDYSNEGITVTGYVGKPEIARGTRSHQSFFLNGRYIKSRMLISAIEEAYKTVLMQNKFPFCVLLLSAPSGSFDVNVHPQKLEVRFANENQVFSTIFHGVKNTLMGTSLIRDFDPKKETAVALDETSKGASLLTRLGPLPEKQSPSHRVNAKPNPVPEQTRLFNQMYSTMPARPAEQPQAEAQSAKATSSTSLQNWQEPKAVRSETWTPYVAQPADKAETHTGGEPEADHAALPPTQEDNASAPGPTEQIQASGGENESRNIAQTPAHESYADTEQHGGYYTETKDETLRDIEEAAIVGQAFDTYILLENGDNLYVIDQHAAHERIRYETLKRRLAREESFSQGVLEPFIIKLSVKEYDFVMEKLEAFLKLGFELESFGPSTVILRSVPDFYDTSFSINDFHEILDRWMETHHPARLISDEALFMMSCKGALKANRSLSKEEIKGLVAELCSMENPFTCVHGRPVIIKMEKRELEKKFKRIV